MEKQIMGRDMENMYQWRKQVQKRYEFYIHKEKEKDVYEYFQTIDNKREYLLDLIKKDMKKKK